MADLLVLCYHGISDVSSHVLLVSPRELHRQLTFLGRRVYRDQIDVRSDLRGRSYYWIGGPEESAADLPGSDCSAVREGTASITPLALDLTHTELIGELARWQVGKFVRAAVEHAKP